MSIDRLIKEGNIHKFQASRQEIGRVMDIAKRDLALAKSISKESLDWAYSIAYNAVLQACRAYMFSLGYRPSASETHKNTFEFMKIALKEPFWKTVVYFDRVRKKRHRMVYDEIGLVTEKEADQLVKTAGEFVAYIEEAIEK